MILRVKHLSFPRHRLIPPEVNGGLGICFDGPKTELEQVFGCLRI